MSNPLELVQAAYAAFGRGDIPALLLHLTSDIEWRFVGDRRAPYTRSVQGQAEVADWFSQVAGADRILTFQPREFLVGSNHVTVLGFERCEALPNGRTFECDWIHVWQTRDGLLAKFLGIFDTERAAEARA